MATITIRIPHRDVEDLDQLFQLSRDFFPAEHLIQPAADHYEFELEGARAKFLLGTLGFAPECRGFVPFVEWNQRQTDQMPLEFPVSVVDGRTG